MSTKLSKILNNKRPLGVYFQSWSSNWSSSANTLDLSNIPAPINMIFLSFVNPNCTYIKGSMNFSGTGLDFSSDFSVIKESIQILKNKGIVIMLSVGGATYPYNDSFNPQNIVNFANDLGVNGIDIDWEPPNGALDANKLAPIINSFRKLYPNGLLSIAAFSVGAYGQGSFVNSQPASNNTGMCIPGLKSNGNQLDFINIMSYDASNAFDPINAFKAYRTLFNGPILIGAEVPPEAWGGHVLNLNEVQSYAKYAIQDSNKLNGLFVWSYQKNGTPSANSIISTAYNVFKSSIPNPTTTTPNPTPNPTAKPNLTPKPNPTAKPNLTPKPNPTPIITPVKPIPNNVNSLVGKTLLNNIFQQDPNPNWIKINNVVLGESKKFGYKTIQSTDIGNLLNTMYSDNNVQVIIYNWSNGTAYIKSGFDLNDSSDYGINTSYTSFIAKRNNTQINTNTNANNTTNTNNTNNTNKLISPKFMPYVDTGAWPTPDLVNIYNNCGVKFFTLAFIVANSVGKPSVCGVYDLDSNFYLDKIKALRAIGGDISFSFGGAAGQELALVISDVNELVNQYQSVIDKYSLKYVDFDIEGGAVGERNSIDTRNKALAIIQKRNPQLHMSYCLPVMPDGLDYNGKYVISSAKTYGFIPDEVRCMSMDYGSPAINGQMGRNVISSAENTYSQVKSLGFNNTKIGIIAMIGLNDVVTEIFDLNDAKSVVSFAKNSGSSYISCLSYWSINRDVTNNVIGTSASGSNSGIIQNAYDFANIFKQF